MGRRLASDPAETKLVLSAYLAERLRSRAPAVCSGRWRSNAAGLTGQVLDTGGPVSASFDDSPPDASLGVPFGFVGGNNARSYDAMSPSERQSAVLNQYETWMGSVRSGERVRRKFCPRRGLT